jgi:hypothetical protein
MSPANFAEHFAAKAPPTPRTLARPEHSAPKLRARRDSSMPPIEVPPASPFVACLSRPLICLLGPNEGSKGHVGSHRGELRHALGAIGLHLTVERGRPFGTRLLFGASQRVDPSTLLQPLYSRPEVTWLIAIAPARGKHRRGTDQLSQASGCRRDLTPQLL